MAEHYSLGAIATPLRGGPFYTDFVSPAPIPDAVDPLRWAKQTIIWDQLRQGSCVGHGTAKALWIWNIQHGILDLYPSRRDAYWQAELREGTQGTDSGAQIYDGLQGFIDAGNCKGTLCRYFQNSYKVAPSKNALADGDLHKILTYHRLMSLREIKQALVTGPVVGGVMVTDGFERVGKDGIIPPSAVDTERLGLHCICWTGYNPDGVWFDNSWGTHWGWKGRGLLPNEWFSDKDMFTDAWIISS